MKTFITILLVFIVTNIYANSENDLYMSFDEEIVVAAKTTNKSKKTDKISSSTENELKKNTPIKKNPKKAVTKSKSNNKKTTTKIAQNNVKKDNVKKDKKQVSKKKSKTVKNKKNDKNTKTKKGKKKKSKEDLDKEKKKKEKEEERKEKVRKADLKKAEWITKTLDFGTHKERKEAIIYIPTVKDKTNKEKLKTKLIKLLDEETDAGVIIKAITTIEELKLKKATPQIIKTLDHNSEDVKISATYALKNFKATQTSQNLISRLEKQDFKENSNYTQALIETLGEFKAIQLKDFAIKKIEDDTTTNNLRLSLLLFLGRSGAKSSKEFLLARFKDNDEELDIRSYAVNSLSKLKVKEVTPDINKVIDEIDGYIFKKRKKYYNFYMYCITALARLGDPKAYPRLLNSLKSNNSMVRLKAIKLLKDLKDKRSIDILKYKAEYDPNAKVQKEAKITLKEFGIDFDEELKKKEKEKKEAKKKKKQ